MLGKEAQAISALICDFIGDVDFMVTIKMGIFLNPVSSSKAGSELNVLSVTGWRQMNSSLQVSLKSPGRPGEGKGKVLPSGFFP